MNTKTLTKTLTLVAGLLFTFGFALDAKPSKFDHISVTKTGINRSVSDSYQINTRHHLGKHTKISGNESSLSDLTLGNGSADSSRRHHVGKHTNFIGEHKAVPASKRLAANTSRKVGPPAKRF